MDKRERVWKKVFGWRDKYHVEVIYSSHSSEEEKLHSCVNKYVCKPESSWEDLTSLLYEEDEMTAVDQARTFLPPRG